MSGESNGAQVWHTLKLAARCGIESWEYPTAVRSQARLGRSP